MNIYVYLDESGNIHKNSKTSFFSIGGYFCLEKDKLKIKAKYKQKNLKIKKMRNIPLGFELKARDMETNDKILLLTSVQDIDSFCGCVQTFDKTKMSREIVESNIFFNYGVKVLFNDCILPLLNTELISEKVNFIVSIDNRNISIGQLHDLEKYLRTEFLMHNYNFSITYYDSANNYCVQLADLIVNTFYMREKEYEMVKDVLCELKNGNFRFSKFPGRIICGRTDEICTSIIQL